MSGHRGFRGEMTSEADIEVLVDSATEISKFSLRTPLSI